MKPENEKIFDEVISLIESGKSVREIFREKDYEVTRSAFNKWLNEDEGKSDQYARATSIRADMLFDEIIEIADKQGEDIKEVDGVKQVNHNIINRNRLQIDSRKWILSKMMPKKYGDKLDVTSGNEKIASLATLPTSELIERAKAVQEISKDE